MMIELSVRFTSRDEKSPIMVSLFRPDGGVSSGFVGFEVPLDEGVLGEVRWYLEVFSSWPTGPDYERAEEIEAKMEGWGRALFESVVADRDTGQIWADFVRDEAEVKLLTIDATDARVLRLPWELLADEGGHVFSQGISVRRRLRKVQSRKVKPFALPVRVLVVVSRPEGAAFIDPRADALPLLDALEALAGRVVVEFLYPPTLKALSARLRDRKAPPVHVVHFDGHGVYDTLLGLGFLLFENEKHEQDRVGANRLGTLLNRCGVPLMVLSACQSGTQQEGDPYASVAARLIRAGMGSVLAMNYSVLVEAAKKFVGAFYGALAEGRTIGQAVDEGRFELFADPDRHTLTRRNDQDQLVEETIRLHDWFLPALYQQAQDPVVFSPHAPTPSPHPPAPSPSGRGGVGSGPGGVGSGPHPESSPTSPLELGGTEGGPRGGEGSASLGSPSPTSPLELGGTEGGPRGGWGVRAGALPVPPRHGFHGRARDLLRLERELAKRWVVVLHGFGGMGKTSLAAEAGRWFCRTGRFPGGAAFVSFEHGGSLEQLCSWVGQAVSGDPNFVLGIQGTQGTQGIQGTQGAQSGPPLVVGVADLLRQRPALVILDNFESVLGRAPLMPADELKAILDAVWRWAQTGARVLITTRDTSFNDVRFAPSTRCVHLALAGLAERDALDLAAAVLDNHAIDRTSIPRQALVDLMGHLGGHPLSLNLVLPHLRHHTPNELAGRFEHLLPGFTTGAAQKRNESLAVSLEFSLRRLGDETRAALPDLAVFQGGAMEDDLLVITEMDPHLWQAARSELEQAALVTVESIPGVTYPFLRFHPTLIPYLATQLAPARRAELEARYWQRYYATADYLYQSDTQYPHQARAIVRRELPNLHRALDLAIAGPPSVPPNSRGEAEEAGKEKIVYFARYMAHFLDDFGRWRERDALMAKLANLPLPTAQSVTQAEFLMISQQGERLLQQGQAAPAEQLFRDLLTRLEADAAYDAAYDIALTHRGLGRCLAAQGRPTQAITWHTRALQGFERLSQSNTNAKKMLGRVYADLGDNLRKSGQFDEAQRAYESSLQICKEVDDHRAVGVALSQLGTLALLRNNLTDAAKRYTEALTTFRALGEPQVEAGVWHQLGMVAQKAQNWNEAERCYRESLKLKEARQDWPGVARTCNQLAVAAEGAGHLDDAERWYLRALDGFEQTGQQYEYAAASNNLAQLYLSQARLDEAADYARRAVAIVETLDLSAEPWKDYNTLARIAEAQGRPDDAVAWRRKEQDSYAAYPGAAYQLPQWAPPFIAAVAQAVRGDEGAKKHVEKLLPQLAATNSWRHLPPAIRPILAGERDFEALRGELDRVDAYIVRVTLSQLPKQ